MTDTYCMGDPMKIALAHDHYEQEHLDRVIEDMKALGAPTIKAVWMGCWDVWAALEGCHRLRAAEVLGLIPEIDPVEYESGTLTSDLGLDYQDETTISEVVDGAYARKSLEF